VKTQELAKELAEEIQITARRIVVKEIDKFADMLIDDIAAMRKIEYAIKRDLQDAIINTQLRYRRASR